MEEEITRTTFGNEIPKRFLVAGKPTPIPSTFSEEIDRATACHGPPVHDVSNVRTPKLGVLGISPRIRTAFANGQE